MDFCQPLKAPLLITGALTVELRPWKATDPLGMNATSDSDCMSCGGEEREEEGRRGKRRGGEGKEREREEGKRRGGGEEEGRRGDEKENGRGGVDSEVQLLVVNVE